MISPFSHPDYIAQYSEWEKYRYIMVGGDDFIENYLVRFSSRENNTDFNSRKNVTPTAAFSRAAIIDIKNSIFQRMDDIVRSGGSKDYQDAINGLRGGVDRRGSSMNYFIGRKVLQELLFLGKIGVYVDMPPINDITLSALSNKIPYFYTYVAEDIINWEVSYQDNTMVFTSILLQDNYYETNQIGLPSKTAFRYRLIKKVNDGITVQLMAPKKKEEKNNISLDTPQFEITEEIFLPLPKIPFVLFELEQPLTRDIANHQIALMNMESSDVAYALKSNYPFYTEQRSEINSSYLKGEENSEKGSEIEVGGNIGRAYSKGTERPNFIHPSSEPLTASMEKQKNLKDDIRMLVNLALSNVRAKFSSAESKEMDEHGLESGLSAIGLILEQGERELASLFSLYEGVTEIPTITYPTKYSLKSDSQKLIEAEKLGEQQSKVPSKSCRKIISKKIATVLVGTETSAEELDKIYQEIDAADYPTGDATDIASDLEHGLVSLKTASLARGYSPKEIEQAKKDHAERIARIALSQSEGAGAENNSAGARGNQDQDTEQDSGDKEKELSQNPDLDETGKKKVRGDA